MYKWRGRPFRIRPKIEGLGALHPLYWNELLNRKVSGTLSDRVTKSSAVHLCSFVLLDICVARTIVLVNAIEMLVQAQNCRVCYTEELKDSF